MPGFSIVSFNAAVQDIRLFGRTLYQPVPFPAERLRRIPRALLDLDADIVCLQEVFHRKWRAWLCETLNRVYPHAAGLETGWPGLRVGNELLVLSRFPLSQTRLHRFRAATPEELRYTSRGFLDLAVQIPAIGEVMLVNLHASAGGLREHPESPVMEEIRCRQIDELLKRDIVHRPMLLVGDLNAGPHSSIANYRQVLGSGMIDGCAEAGIEGVTWDPANPLVAGGREAHLLPQRIDHIFINPELAATTVCTGADIVLTEHLVDSGASKLPLSDHYAIRAVFRTHQTAVRGTGRGRLESADPGG